MQRRVIVHNLRIFAVLFLLISFLLIMAVRVSDKGDIVDRNANWILLVFVIALGGFIYTVFVPDLPKENRRKKTIDELMNEIKKPNLDKLKCEKKQHI